MFNQVFCVTSDYYSTQSHYTLQKTGLASVVSMHAVQVDVEPSPMYSLPHGSFLVTTTTQRG
jgi:hypothetical protein